MTILTGDAAQQYARPGDPALSHVVVHEDGSVTRRYGTPTTPQVDRTDALANIVRNAGWLDEDSDEQAVYLLTNLVPIMESLVAQVQAIDPADLATITSDLNAF